MEKELIKKILDEIVNYCETIKEIKENSNSHVGLRKLLKSNYEISEIQINDFLKSLSAKIKQSPNKEIIKLDEKIINLCKIVNISYKEKESEQLDYSKIRNRVSNMRQSIKKRELKASQK